MEVLELMEFLESLVGNQPSKWICRILIRCHTTIPLDKIVQFLHHQHIGSICCIVIRGHGGRHLHMVVPIRRLCIFERTCMPLSGIKINRIFSQGSTDQTVGPRWPAKFWKRGPDRTTDRENDIDMAILEKSILIMLRLNIGNILQSIFQYWYC